MTNPLVRQLSQLNVNTNTFFLHAGGSKTGSTAIQNFCESNTDRLQQYGVSYENRLGITSDYMMGSGNGFALYQAVMARQSDDVATLLKGHMGSTARCVCSSEYFADLSKEDCVHWIPTVTESSSLQILIAQKSPSKNTPIKLLEILLQP